MVACLVVYDVVVAVVDGIAVGVILLVVGVDSRVPVATVVDDEVTGIEVLVVGDVVVVAVVCVVVLVEVSTSKKVALN